MYRFQSTYNIYELLGLYIQTSSSRNVQPPGLQGQHVQPCGAISPHKNDQRAFLVHVEKRKWPNICFQFLFIEVEVIPRPHHSYRFWRPGSGLWDPNCFQQEGLGKGSRGKKKTKYPGEPHMTQQLHFAHFKVLHKAPDVVQLHAYQIQNKKGLVANVLLAFLILPLIFSFLFM